MTASTPYRGLATFPVEEQAREAAEFHRWKTCHHLSSITQVVNGEVVLSCSHCWADMTGWHHNAYPGLREATAP